MGQSESAGKPSIDCTVGLDIGGTKTSGAVVDPDGQVLFHRTIPTQPQRGGAAVVDDVLSLTRSLFSDGAARGVKPVGIGISICELVDQQGQVVSDETIRWRDLAVREQFAQIAPTTFDADSRSAALCEARFGAGQDCPLFLYVTIGTGIGCSLVIDGRPFGGARGLTGTMATGPLSVPCSSCGQLSRTVVEEIGSGPAICRRYRDRSGRTVEGAQEVLEAARKGDRAASEVLMAAATSVGSVMGLLINVLDPQRVIVGGGLGSADGLFWEWLQSATRQHIWSPIHRQVPIVQGKCGPLAAAIGAAIVAQENR